MTSRILSQRGNVIAADFRPRSPGEITIRLTTETLFCDDRVTLIRIVGRFEGKPYFATHLLADLITGTIATL